MVVCSVWTVGRAVIVVVVVVVAALVWTLLGFLKKSSQAWLGLAPLWVSETDRV